MLEPRDICKEYHAGDTVRKALDHVSITFRDNEFTAILGPSGSGKTTLLNIIGGLDRYSSGHLVINGVSTRKYTDRDSDAYRNHTISFIFQGYNLISHQTVLTNVELALTISGISGKERRERAVSALEKAGLKDHLYKKPSQLSGGQMQRVAIARAWSMIRILFQRMSRPVHWIPRPAFRSWIFCCMNWAYGTVIIYSRWFSPLLPETVPMS